MSCGAPCRRPRGGARSSPSSPCPCSGTAPARRRARQPRRDHRRHVLAALDRALRDARDTGHGRHVADHEHLGMPGQRQLGRDHDPPRAVQSHLAERRAERRGLHARRPDHRLGRDPARLAGDQHVQALGVDADRPHAQPHVDPQPRAGRAPPAPTAAPGRSSSTRWLESSSTIRACDVSTDRYSDVQDPLGRARRPARPSPRRSARRRRSRTSSTPAARPRSRPPRPARTRRGSSSAAGWRRRRTSSRARAPPSRRARSRSASRPRPATSVSYSSSNSCSAYTPHHATRRGRSPRPRPAAPARAETCGRCPQRRRDLPARQQPGRHLVEQRLEDEVVRAVDQRDLRARRPSPAPAPPARPAKPPPTTTIRCISAAAPVRVSGRRRTGRPASATRVEHLVRRERHRARRPRCRTPRPTSAASRPSAAPSPAASRR